MQITVFAENSSDSIIQQSKIVCFKIPKIYMNKFSKIIIFYISCLLLIDFLLSILIE